MAHKIIFISHDASRTGAPIILLHLLQWIKNNTNHTPVVILKEGGELEAEFKKLAQCVKWVSKNKKTKKYRALFDAARQFFILRWLHKFNPSLIYANSVVSLDLGSKLKLKFNCPMICHFHELEVAINRYFGKNNFMALKDNVDLYIGVSNAVIENLVTNHGITKKNTCKILPFVPTKKYSLEEKNNTQLKYSLGIPENALVIGGCGTLDWRKSPDIFIMVANQVKKIITQRSIYFVWVGDGREDVMRELDYDLKKLALDKVMFVGKKETPLEYFKIFDVFFLASREEPWGMVCLEAASLSMPIVCFDQAGGMPEFVQQDCGIIVPYLDIQSAACAIIQLAEDAHLRDKMGQAAQKKAIHNHDVEVACHQIERMFNPVVSAHLHKNKKNPKY
jgi:glycosyltransferase involved in cell wall biosynthesis